MHKKDFFPTSRIFIFMTKLVPNKLCIAFIKLNEILNHTAIDMLPEPTALQQFPQTTIFVSFDTINISIYLYSKCFLSQFYLNIFNILIQMLYISFFFFYLRVRLSDIQVPRCCLIHLINYFYDLF